MTGSANMAGQGVSSVLWDNLWGTNYIMWFPYNQNYAPVPGEADLRYRYVLRAT